MRVAIALLLSCSAALAQQKPDDKTPPPIVDDVKVDKAIKSGIAWLVKENKSPGHAHSQAKHSDELLLWTFIHAEVPETDAKFQQMLDRILKDPLEQTYKVALQAMILEELDPAKYQRRIAQCGQFLIDNQCSNGQWSYGDPTPHVDSVPEPAKSVASKGEGGIKVFDAKLKKKERPATRINLAQKKNGPANGDNSNSQYAALGLRACHDANVGIPEGVIALAMKWWRESQFKGDKKNDSVASGGAARAAGWNYKTEGSGDAYLSMSAGAVGSLVIYDHMIGREWKRDSSIVAGLGWLQNHFSVEKNSGRPKPADWYFYALYALERAAILYGTERIGTHWWYAEGANHLLKIQKPDGKWEGESEEVWNTCFAILFLKRATKAIATEAGGSRN